MQMLKACIATSAAWLRLQLDQLLKKKVFLRIMVIWKITIMVTL